LSFHLAINFLACSVKTGQDGHFVSARKRCLLCKLHTCFLSCHYYLSYICSYSFSFLHSYFDQSINFLRFHFYCELILHFPPFTITSLHLILLLHLILFLFINAIRLFNSLSFFFFCFPHTFFISSSVTHLFSLAGDFIHCIYLSV
jgi:hypothetical protein